MVDGETAGEGDIEAVLDAGVSDMPGERLWDRDRGWRHRRGGVVRSGRLGGDADRELWHGVEEGVHVVAVEHQQNVGPRLVEQVLKARVELRGLVLGIATGDRRWVLRMMRHSEPGHDACH